MFKMALEMNYEKREGEGRGGGEGRDTTRKNNVGEINTGDFVFVFVKFY